MRARPLTSDVPYRSTPSGLPLSRPASPSGRGRREGVRCTTTGQGRWPAGPGSGFAMAAAGRRHRTGCSRPHLRPRQRQAPDDARPAVPGRRRPGDRPHLMARALPPYDGVSGYGDGTAAWPSPYSGPVTVGRPRPPAALPRPLRLPAERALVRRPLATGVRRLSARPPALGGSGPRRRPGRAAGARHLGGHARHVGRRRLPPLPDGAAARPARAADPGERGRLLRPLPRHLGRRPGRPPRRHPRRLPQGVPRSRRLDRRRPPRLGRRRRGARPGRPSGGKPAADAGRGAPAGLGRGTRLRRRGPLAGVGPDLEHTAVSCGHFMAEQAPAVAVKALRDLLDR